MEKINIIQTDKELVDSREKVIALISETGIEPFSLEDESEIFASYNILKEEFISIRKDSVYRNLNYIDISKREIDNEILEFRVLNYSIRVNDQNYILEIGKSLPKILYSQRNIREVMVMFMISMLLLMLVSDLLFTKNTVLPLKQIMKKLRKTSTPALFDQTPVKTSTSDFLQLDVTISELMKKLDTMFSMEKEITVNISHELLTPVSVLRSRLENLLLRETMDMESKEKIEESLNTIYRLKTLINSLLLISRIESRQYLKDDSFEMKELIEQVIDELSPLAVDKDIIIEKDIREAHYLSGANRSLLFSMIYNVLNNSIQNTDNNGRISVKGLMNNERFTLSVIDTGHGMTPDQLGNIFSRFRKKPDYNNERNGIGLSITKTIADFHDIKLSIHSEPGKGTEISFSFPENS